MKQGHLVQSRTNALLTVLRLAQRFRSNKQGDVGTPDMPQHEYMEAHKKRHGERMDRAEKRSVNG